MGRLAEVILFIEEIKGIVASHTLSIKGITKNSWNF